MDRNTQWIEATIAVGLTFLALSYLIAVGFLRLRHLKGGDEAKVYILVFAIGIGIACLASVAAFATYRLGASEYLVDHTVASELASELAASMADQDSLLVATDTLIGRLRRGTGPLELIRRPGWWFLASGAQLQTRRLPELGEWSIHIDAPYAGGVPGPATVEFRSPRGRIVVDPLVTGSQAAGIGLAWFNGQTQVQREALIDALIQRAQYAGAVREVEQAASGYVPVTTFLYQGAMAFLGANPSYLVPSNGPARAIALVGAIFRALFAALVLSLFVRKWTEKSVSDSAA